MTRICKHYGEDLPVSQFAINRKDGKEYRLWKCNGCRHQGCINKGQCAENRAFNELARWPVPE